MGYKLIFNNINLDDTIADYTTIDVKGRGLFVRNINSISISGRDGEYITESKYPGRKVIVDFLINSKNHLEYFKTMQKLNNSINSDKDVIFKVTDEDGYRLGRVTEVTDPALNKGVGSFTIFCQNPFVFGDKLTVDKTIKSKYSLDVKIENITAKITNGTNKVILRNETKGTKIILNGNFTKDDILEISKEKIFLNKKDIKSYLDFVESDYHDFKLFDNNVVTITNATNLKIEYRERWY
jgi:predicted phage tail component-like protein